MREYSFTLTEHDPDKPWLVLKQTRQTVNLPDGASFFDWARTQWPDGQYVVQLDPWQISS